MQMTDFRITIFHRTAQHLSGARQREAVPPHSSGLDDCFSSQTLPLFDVVGA